MRSCLIAGLVASALCGCGGGGSSADPVSRDAIVPAASAPITASAPAGALTPASTPVVQIDVYGDDGIAGFTTNSFGMVSLVTPNETQTLQSLLQTQFNDTGMTVVSHATGGLSSSLMAEMMGADGNGAPFADRIKSSSAQIVIESHARNDFLGGETVDDYRRYLAAWVVAVRAAGKIPVLEESGPVCDSEHPQLAAYVQAMDDAAAQFNVPIVTQFAYISGLPNWQAHMASCLYPDAFVLQLKAQREQAVIAPLVKTMMAG